MLVYDTANKLAKEIQECTEYKEYKELKEKVMADEQTKSLLKDYKKLQLEAQAAYLGSGEPSAESLEKLKKLGEVLTLNKEVTEFFAAEYKFQTLVGDIYNIIGKACDLGLDFLKE
jgi:cell fate (sporulation/competence/biofilm development) regulator YlbF (YheA/YmcA/DUF963 family)